MPETRLTQLCRICSNATPKYQCPRCNARTCSLPCYKRHQKWSQCTGKRDPAAFVSKNCLATPAGLDRDYNFISTIEHAVDRAGHEQNDRGIDGKRPGLDSKRQINARGPPLQRALQNADIKVYRAPLGMNRQRENDTKWDTKRKHVLWTVEWFHPNGSRELSRCRDHETVSSLFDQVPSKTRSERAKRQRRRHYGLDDPSKRSKTTEDDQDSVASTNIASNHDVGLASTGMSSPYQAHLETTKRDPSTDAREIAETPRSDPNLNLLEPTCQVQHEVKREDPEASMLKYLDSSLDNLKAEPDSSDHPASKEANAPNRHFYLVKHFTRGPFRVLIPISPSDNLLTILNNQTVFEFPTIQVLHEPPSSLMPDGFQLDSEYAKYEEKLLRDLDDQFKQDEFGAARLAGAITRLDEPATVKQEVLEPNVNESTLFESLRKDMATFGGR